MQQFKRKFLDQEQQHQHYCVVCGKYKKFKNSKISYLLEKTLVLSIICSKCNSKNEMIFKEEEWIKILKILGLINNIEQYHKVWQNKT